MSYPLWYEAYVLFISYTLRYIVMTSFTISRPYIPHCTDKYWQAFKGAPNSVFRRLTLQLKAVCTIRTEDFDPRNTKHGIPF